jgi:hypothetical protein
MLRKHSSRSARCAAAVAEIEWCAAVYGFEIRPVHIRTEDNTIADAGSRRLEEDFDNEAFEQLMQEFERECEIRCPQEPAECAPERPDLIGLWKQHVVQLDVWENTLSSKDKQELEKLLPEYMRCKQVTSALRADGGECATAREKVLESTAPKTAEGKAKAEKAKQYQRQREGRRQHFGFPRTAAGQPAAARDGRSDERL